MTKMFLIPNCVVIIINTVEIKEISKNKMNEV